MRRLGAILMILGANLVVGAIAIAFYIAAYGCAADPACNRGALSIFVNFMTSAHGIIFWLIVAAGIVTFRKGTQLRARERGDR